MSEEDYITLIQQLAALEDIRIRMESDKAFERDLVHEIYKLLPKKKVTIPPFGVVEKASSANRKWDNEEMFNVLLARARDARLIDKETGEVLESEGQAVRRVIEECAYVGYWKLTPLREKYGVDPDEFYETTSRRKSIRLIKSS